ncbi:hypothetical protein [Deinococcus irradiatisoli]|uniref:hypothetical protein n=1 Tax=Deinococcus irradiatisoli TaxID=2202254 RepID=UPI0015E83C01|nr:hypothetical protein [Deinococcus irradiatisoli]
MNSRVLGLMVTLLILLNLGGALAVVLSLGRGDGRALSTLTWVLLLDAAGFWLLRQLRD